MTATRIMVVEDDPLVAEKFRIQLTGLGYNVVSVVDSGEQAVIQARATQPELIIMDIVLAGDMDGIDAAATIHESDNIPVVYATAYTDEQFFQRSGATAPFGYLIKPVAERELEITLRIALYHSELESRLIRNERHLSDAQRIGLLGSWEWDIRNNNLVWSDQMFRIFGQQPQSFGANYQAFMDRVHPEDRSHVQMAVDSALANEKHFCISYRVITMDGNIYRVQAEGEVTFDEHGSPLRMIGTAQDISVIMQTQDDLWHLAHHDPLTGLANRNLLYDRISQAIFRAERERKQVAVMLLDLDHFKDINDTFGHDKGDDFLNHVAARLRQALRDDDTLARLGGDEFVVVTIINKHSDALKIARKLHDLLHTPLLMANAEILPSASTGIAIYPDHGRDYESLLKAADIAMYQSKHKGKNTYSIYMDDENNISDIRTKENSIAN